VLPSCAPAALRHIVDCHGTRRRLLARVISFFSLYNGKSRPAPTLTMEMHVHPSDHQPSKGYDNKTGSTLYKHNEWFIGDNDNKENK
jgi:hypothetical protein